MSALKFSTKIDNQNKVCFVCYQKINNPRQRYIVDERRTVCSAKCNNQLMGSIQYWRDKRRNGERFRIWGHGSNEVGEHRWWLYIGVIVLHLELCFKTFWQLGIRFELEDQNADDFVSGSIQIPFFAMYFSIDVPYKIKHQYCPDGTNRELSLYLFDGSICWSLWADTWDGNNEYPWWRHMYFSPKDFFLGDVKRIKEEIIREGDCEVVMPEGTYKGTYKVERLVYKRRRWFSWERISTWITIPGCIPFQGKGENSWDCGDDGLTGSGVSGDDLKGAITHFYATVMEYRARYGQPSQKAIDEALNYKQTEPKYPDHLAVSKSIHDAVNNE